MASLLQRRRSLEANQTLHDVGRLLRWCTIYTFSGALSADRILPGANFTLRSSLALSYIGSVTARHSSRGRQPSFAALSRGRHLYSVGRPSRWASAHILVTYRLSNGRRCRFRQVESNSHRTRIRCRIVKYSTSIGPQHVLVFRLSVQRFRPKTAVRAVRPTIRADKSSARDSDILVALIKDL